MFLFNTQPLIIHKIIYVILVNTYNFQNFLFIFPLTRYNDRKRARTQTGQSTLWTCICFYDIVLMILFTAGGNYMSVTIKQIAALANVSRGTVDRVLNNRPGVNPDTREKVLKIAGELHYQPNFLAKALVNSKENIKLGVILTPDYNPFIHQIIKGIEDAQEEFRAFGLKVIIKMMTTLEAAEELKIIHELEAENVNGMAVFPLDHPQIVSVLNHLIENGTAILTFNSKADTIHDLCFIGQNHYKGGRTAGGLMGKILPPDGQVGVIISTADLSCHQERLKGFQEKLGESYPKIQILEIRSNQDRKDDAFKITLEYCNKYPDLAGIYITGGGVAGVGSALDIAGRTASVHVICHDLIPDSIALLQSGVVDFVLGQEPTLQGYQIVKTLFEYLVKDIEPPKLIDIPVTIAINESL